MYGTVWGGTTVGGVICTYVLYYVLFVFVFVFVLVFGLGRDYLGSLTVQSCLRVSAASHPIPSKVGR
jgi:hypothetical protein